MARGIPFCSSVMEWSTWVLKTWVSFGPNKDRSKLTHDTYTHIHQWMQLAVCDMIVRGWKPTLRLSHLHIFDQCNVRHGRKFFFDVYVNCIKLPPLWIMLVHWSNTSSCCVVNELLFQTPCWFVLHIWFSSMYCGVWSLIKYCIS